MSHITKLMLHNVRCFSKPQPVELGKITLLVGENSTGKSTFLGCCKAFVQLSSFQELKDPDPRKSQSYFNEPPFLMGPFDTIVRRGEDSFSLEGYYENHCYSRVSFLFSSDKREDPAYAHVHPSDCQLMISFPDEKGGERTLTATKRFKAPETWRLGGPGFSMDIPGSETSYKELSSWFSQSVRRGQMPFGGDVHTYRSRMRPVASPDSQAEFAKLVNFLRTMPFPKELITIEALDPRASSYFRKRWHDRNPLYNWSPELRKFLSRSGDQLGLFSTVDIKRTRQTEYELRVKQHQQWYNIADVGFGVSSILPLLQDIFQRPQGTMFLLQQPEIHLHPSSQAKLAEIMVSLPYKFIIETHSDHLLDRLRICVMEGKLRPADLKIAYFEQKGSVSNSTIHNISVDEAGNIDGEPRGYRTFFLKETHRLLGFQ